MAENTETDYEGRFRPQSQVVMAVALFSVLSLALNTSVFVGWAREAPFSPAVTEWLIAVADRIDAFGNEAGFDGLRNWFQLFIEDIRS